MNDYAMWSRENVIIKRIASGDIGKDYEQDAGWILEAGIAPSAPVMHNFCHSNVLRSTMCVVKSEAKWHSLLTRSAANSFAIAATNCEIMIPRRSSNI